MIFSTFTILNLNISNAIAFDSEDFWIAAEQSKNEAEISMWRIKYKYKQFIEYDQKKEFRIIRGYKRMRIRVNEKIDKIIDCIRDKDYERYYLKFLEEFVT